MLTLINSNRMMPPIAPLGLDYVGTALRWAGIEVDLLDLSLAEDAEEALPRHFAVHQPELIGISFRNIDDCFWPSGASFAPDLVQLVAKLHTLSDAPVVLGGIESRACCGRRAAGCGPTLQLGRSD
jgi:hypothetical protein